MLVPGTACCQNLLTSLCDNHTTIQTKMQGTTLIRPMRMSRAETKIPTRTAQTQIPQTPQTPETRTVEETWILTI